jgi:hypothetical protein
MGWPVAWIDHCRVIPAGWNGEAVGERQVVLFSSPRRPELGNPCLLVGDRETAKWSPHEVTLHSVLSNIAPTPRPVHTNDERSDC